MAEAFLVPGLRTPFVKAGTAFAAHTALELSAPIAAAMNEKTKPDFLVWGQVIPDPTLSNIARELIFQAKLDPEIPSFSDVMACSTSFVGTIFASGMVGRSDMHLALVGGVETMSHVPLALKMGMADKIIGQFTKNPAAAADLLAHITPNDFDLPIHVWANRISGRSMGEHTEETAQRFAIARADQDARALLSH
jgi:acetyl-CoA C-acetyltransferase/acetyl-CoA acyltransferase